MNTPAKATTPDWRAAKYGRRKLVNKIALTLSVAAMLFGIFWLFWILWETLRNGLGGLSLAAFTQTTPAPMEIGGIANAIWGSMLMVAVGSLIGTPIGIMAGIYLAEYNKHGWLASTTRFVNDILLSAPSIVIGVFVSTILVAPFKTFSGWAGSVALSLLVIPVVIRTTENMLNLVPGGLREAAYALGTPKWKVIYSITLKASRSGVITGILLAVARISGETAPLLFTAMNNQFWSSNMSAPMANLPAMIYSFAMSPYENWHSLAWAGAFVLTLFVLLISLFARAIVSRNRMTHD